MRLHYVTASDSHARAIVSVLASVLQLPSSSSSVSLHLGNAVLEFSALPAWVNYARQSRVLKRPLVSRLRAIEVFTGTSCGEGSKGSTAAQSSFPHQNARAWLTEDRPLITPTFQKSSFCSAPTNAVATPFVREVVLGAGLRWVEMTRLVTDELDAIPCPGFPHLYVLHAELSDSKAPPSSGIFVRLLHSPMSAVVLQVRAGGLNKLKEDLRRRGVTFEEIGSTGATEGQLLLSSHLLRGLDVRLCDADAVLSPYFNEGDEVLREHVIEELNPGLSLPLASMEAGQQANSPAEEYRRMGARTGDCWSEFRSQIKRPGGFFTASSPATPPK